MCSVFQPGNSAAQSGVVGRPGRRNVALQRCGKFAPAARAEGACGPVELAGAGGTVHRASRHRSTHSARKAMTVIAAMKHSGMPVSSPRVRAMARWMIAIFLSS